MRLHERALTALSDPTRRRVLEILSVGSQSVGELANELPISQPAVSQHLSNLLAAGLVSVEPQGRRRLYRVDETGLIAVRRYIDSMWTDVLSSFQRAAEEADHD